RGATPPLHLVCVHLGLLERERQAQLGVLHEIIEDEVPPGEPLVVAGDFNDWRLRADARLAHLGLTAVFRESHGRHARSFPSTWPVLRLDRIYTRDVHAIRPLPIPRRPWWRLSDHAPLAAELQLQEAA